MIKWNTNVHILQFVIITIGLIQLLNNAKIMALFSVSIVYLIGALKNSGCDFDNDQTK